VQRLSKLEKISDKEAAQKIIRMDKSRASYYNELTDKKWGLAQSYDLCVNAGRLGHENTVKLILNYLSLRI
jgi:cytidylate kinase